MVDAVPKLESEVGMEVYASKGRGIDGRIRRFPEDFVVEEILTDGSKASVQIEKADVQSTERGRYLVCVLVKKGWDTLVAVRKIADALSLDSERIRFAGIKDTRALTAQHISIGGVSAERVREVSFRDMALTPIRFSNEEVSSNLLFGNQFTIVARSVKLRRSTVKRRIEKIRKELADLGGVPNFFGHQRFGTVRPITHKVGRSIVKEDFENAVMIFLSQPSAYEHPKARKARGLLRETQDFKAALKYFPKSLMYERLMLIHLSKHPRDFLGALRRLSPSLLRLLVQAYQSFLFNRFLSERIRRGFPLSEVYLGDYTVNLDEKRLLHSGFSKGKTATALPLVGFRQSYSGGAQGEIEKEILEEEEASPQDFRISKMPEASAPGGLRTVLAPILDLNVGEEASEASSHGLSVIFGFKLLRGSYATVVLREFMKSKDLIKAGY